MAATHTSPTWFSYSQPRGPKDVVHVVSTRRQSIRTLTAVRTRKWQELLPDTDINGSIALSTLRCIVTLISLALLVTDIPRTGLGVYNLLEYFPSPLMPSTAVRVGPFNYPISHIWRLDNRSSSGNATDPSTSTEFAGLEGTESVSATRVWPYQYDTTSIGLRGAVELLDVTKFPDFLLYKDQSGQSERDADSFLKLGTVFSMLDGFIAAAQTKLNPLGDGMKTLRYATKHNWVDRFHHYVVQFATKNPAWRLHSLHTMRITSRSPSIGICAKAAITKRAPLRPRFCNHPGIWKCQHPVDGSLSPVRVWEHIDLRLQILQRRYPGLELDAVLLSSHRISSTSGALRLTIFDDEALEVVVLTRGRQCGEDARKAETCSTVFVDDYRYERDSVQTNLVDWYATVSILRGSAQLYVWTRLMLLVYGTVAASADNCTRTRTFQSNLVSTVFVVLRIPFQVVVYSSLLPVCGYVTALLLDSSFMDIFLDSYRASVGGIFDFEPVSFLKTTAVQMRNVWLLALLATFLVFALKRTCSHCQDGVPGIRGLAISFVSALTIAGPYKRTTFRDTNIIDMFQLRDEGPTMDIVHCNPSEHVNASSYIFDDSATMLLFCIGTVLVLAMAIKTLGFSLSKRSWVSREMEGVIFNSTPFVPCGASRLWLMSTLSVRFQVSPRVAYLSRVSLSKSSLSLNSDAATARHASLLQSQQTKVLPFHAEILPRTASVVRSSQQIRLEDSHGCFVQYRSVLKLMNVAMMTDPLNFIRLRLIGIQLYLYRIRAGPLAMFGMESTIRSCVVILPYSADEMKECTGLNPEDFELLDTASSRDVPMSVLLQCG